MLFSLQSLCIYYRYPNPSDFTYKRRLFHPFQYALQPPSCHERMIVNKPAVPPGMPEPYKVPRCFVIPGNHGWSQFLLSAAFD